MRPCGLNLRSQKQQRQSQLDSKTHVLPARGSAFSRSIKYFCLFLCTSVNLPVGVMLIVHEETLPEDLRRNRRSFLEGAERIEVRHVFRHFQKVQHKNAISALIRVSCAWDGASFCIMFRRYFRCLHSKHTLQLASIPPFLSTISLPHQTTVSVAGVKVVSSTRLGCISSLKALVRTTFKDSLNRFFLLLPTKK